MENLISNLPLKNFQENLSHQANIIEEKETKILLALGDLLEQKDNYENFINNSLGYLKINYGLTKGVWKVLLNLHDKIPNFTKILSNWTVTIPPKPTTFEEFFIHSNIPHPNLPFYLDHRKQSIQHLFLMIDSLVPHFSQDAICELVPLLSDNFDYEQSSFSLSKFKSENPNFTHHQLIRIQSVFNSRIYTLHFSLKNLCDDFYYTNKKYFPKDYEKYIENLKNRLLKIDLKSNNPKDSIINIKNIFNKYTKNPFLSYLGFKDLSQSIIDEEDENIVNLLIKSYEKSFPTSTANLQITVSLLKILYSYKNNLEHGWEKILEIIDYLIMSNDYYTQCLKNPNFKVKDLLAWSNCWHLNGLHLNPFIEKTQEFENYNINYSIEEYKFIQITNSYDLYLQGKNQKHCVFNYKESCLNNKTIIVSMKDRSNNIISTLMFQIGKKKSFFKKYENNVRLVENRKKNNQSCSDYEKNISHEYEKYIQKIIKL